MDEDFDDLPAGLSADLGKLYRAGVTSSPKLDQAILNRARAQFAGRRRTLFIRRLGLVAAAACVIAAVGIPLIRPTSRQIAGDINADGVVDIRDALALARKVEQNKASPSDDMNHDRIVDARDVDAIAMIAVKVESVR